MFQIVLFLPSRNNGKTVISTVFFSAKKPHLYLQCEEDTFGVLRMKMLMTLRRRVVKEGFLEEKTPEMEPRSLSRSVSIKKNFAISPLSGGHMLRAAFPTIRDMLKETAGGWDLGDFVPCLGQVT